MKAKIKHIILAGFVLLSCSNLYAQDSAIEATDDYYTIQYYRQVMGYDVRQIQNLLLFDIVDQWLNTPYRYAGIGENGIDCSHFVITVYASVYNRVLEGSSDDIYRKSTKINKRQLREGDLVFFKIRSRHVTHVGIYLGEHKFVHSSTKAGVIISDLDEPYYHKYFKGAGRIE